MRSGGLSKGYLSLSVLLPMHHGKGAFDKILLSYYP
jgi:hypothetical protein